MIPSVRDAFSGAKPPSAPTRARLEAQKGGLELLYHVHLSEFLGSAALSSGGMLAVTTADQVIIVDAKDGTVSVSSDALGDDPPNAVAWSPGATWIVCCSDDGYAGVMASSSGTVALEHLVAEDAEPGKRRRCVPSDHAIFVTDNIVVAAAGRLIHACLVPGGDMQHSVAADAPVCALCRSPPNLEAHWAYAAGYKGGVLLVSTRGERVGQLYSRGHLRSLAVSAQWLAGGGFDGTLELWDVAKRAEEAERPSEAEKTLMSFCGSDGVALAWNIHGGSLAVTGKRAAVIDFTGEEPPHPYRSAAFAAATYQRRPGEPDPVPRVCMGDSAQRLAWAPHRSPGTTNALATTGTDGVLHVWRPYSLPLRKGGVGNPAQPHRMKPQFYTHLKADAAHPSGEARSTCALMWLSDSTVAACYDKGDLVAWQLAV